MEGLVTHEATALKLVTGIVVAPVPANDGTGLMVRVDPQSQPYGPCPWAQKSASKPVAGTKCLVAFDENNSPWVVMWVGATS